MTTGIEKLQKKLKALALFFKGDKDLKNDIAKICNVATLATYLNGNGTGTKLSVDIINFLEDRKKNIEKLTK